MDEEDTVISMYTQGDFTDLCRGPHVENTKLSTWAGSSNITTIGTLSSGTVPWARLSDVPSSFTPSSHTHNLLVTEGDNRTVATTPNDYSNKIIFRGLKTNSSFNSPSS